MSDSLTLAVFIILWFPFSLHSLLLSLAGIAGSTGSHSSGEWVSFSFFFFNPNLLLLPSLQPHPSIQMHNAWREYRRCISMCHWGCPQSNSTQTDVIYQPSLRKPRYKREKEGEGERGRKEEEQRNDQGGFWKAAGSKSDPTCYNTSTHKHSRIVTMVRIWFPHNYASSLLPVYLLFAPTMHSYPHPIPPTVSRLSLVNNKEGNLWWIYSLFHWETSHCVFSFRLKGTIKVVRWAHYDLLVLNRSHQSQWMEGVGCLYGWLVVS